MSISNLFKYFFLCLLFSCSNIVVREKGPSQPQEMEELKPALNVEKKDLLKDEIAEYVAKKFQIRPGEVTRVDLKDPSEKNYGKVFCHNKKIPFVKNNNFLTFYVSESYFSKLKPFNCDYVFDSGESVELAKFDVAIKKFPFEKLNVNKRKVFYSKKDVKRILKEKKELDLIYSSGEVEPFFNEPFKAPLRTKITSIFGTRRLFNNNKKSQHLGTDYRARIGRKIRSSNSGKVVLSKSLFFSGNTVILDHGMGIFTLYGHLSKSIAKVGQVLDKNALLGAAGMTGRVTGPHLHWGVKVHGEWVDGHSLIKQ